MVKPTNLMTSTAESESCDFFHIKVLKEVEFHFFILATFFGAAHVLENVISVQLWKVSGTFRTISFIKIQKRCDVPFLNGLSL